MDPYRPRDRAPAEFRLSSDAVRRVADQVPPPSRTRRFLSTDHLSAEAVAAFVDGRLPQIAAARADAHMTECPRCRREVADQHDARRALRGSGPIRMPEDLRDRLRSLGESPPGDASERSRPGRSRAAGEPAAPPGPSPVAAWTRMLRRLRGRGR